MKVFSFGDLKNATGSFRSGTVLGVGGFGTVYKGFVEEKTLAPTKFGSGMIVAIKKLNPESMQGFQEWQVIKLIEFPILKAFSKSFLHIYSFIFWYMYQYLVNTKLMTFLWIIKMKHDLWV